VDEDDDETVRIEMPKKRRGIDNFT
jgi:hypothetical protein